jgi:hypothetical protein
MAKNINEKQKEILARKLGYDGPMNMFEQFVKSDPGMERKYNSVIEKYMARGGMVKKYAQGGAVSNEMDFRQIDITQYPLTTQQRVDVSRYLQQLPALESQLTSKIAARDTSAPETQRQLTEAKNAITTTLKSSELALNGALSNYLVYAGRALKDGDQATLNRVTSILDSTFAAYNAEVPPLIKDQQYVTDAYNKIAASTNRYVADGPLFSSRYPPRFNNTRAAYEKAFAETFIRSTDAGVSVITPKENLVQDYVASVETGNTPSLAVLVPPSVNSRDSKKGYIDPQQAAQSYGGVRDINSALAGSPGFRASQNTAGELVKNALIIEKSISAPKYAEKYRPETLAMLEMAQGKRQANLSYDLDGDGKITDKDTNYFANAKDTNNDGRVTLQEAAAFAQEEIRRLQPPAPAQPAAPAQPPATQQPITTTPTVTPTTPAGTGQVPGVTTPTAPTIPGVTTPTAPVTGGQPTITPTTTSPTGAATPTTAVGVGTPTPTQPVPFGTPTTPITEASRVTGTVTTPTGPGVGSVTSPLTSPVSPAPPVPTAPTTRPLESVTAPAQEFPAGTSGELPEKAPGMTNVPQIDTAVIQPTLEQQVSTPTAPTAATTAIPQMATGTAQVADVIPRTASTVSTTFGTPLVGQALTGLQPAMGTVSQEAQVQAATMAPTSTAVGDLQAAQGVAGTVQGAPTRTLQEGELVSGPTVDQAKIEATLQANEAAQGVVTEDMTVQGQLAKLTANFEAGNPPAWAAASLRNANAILSQRGLGASSLAGQAIVQAALEAALPIAAADAQTYREMGIQNLSNKQQMAVLTAQQRAAFLGQEFDQAFQTRTINAATISQIANVNFSAQQQIALENSRLAESVNLANLSNRQALVLAEAAQIANLETANLNNRQQANVLNAQAFLQMDMANLNNRQQTALFKAQSMVQSIMSDAAADNAAKQFNASSINQVNQFYDGLSTQIKQFNATQTNAMNQFNVGQLNSIGQFNASMQNQRDQFNAEFRKVIDQSNAEWRRNIALQNTAAINRTNEFNATAALGVTTIEYNNLWQDYRDKLEYAWKTTQNALDRENELARQVLAKQAQIEAAKMQVEAEKMKALGSLAATALDKTNAFKAAGDFLFGSSGPSGGAAGSSGGGAVGAVAGVAQDVAKKVWNAITSTTSTGYTEVANNAAPGTERYGWRQYTDADKNTVLMNPEGTQYWLNNQLVYDKAIFDMGGTLGSEGFTYDFAGASDLSRNDFLYNYSGVSE